MADRILMSVLQMLLQQHGAKILELTDIIHIGYNIQFYIS